MKNTSYKPMKPVSEWNGTAHRTTRPLETWGAGVHCPFCHLTRVFLKSDMTHYGHQCKGFNGFLDCYRTLIYGEPNDAR